MARKQWKLYKVTRFTQKERDEFVAELEEMRRTWAKALPYAEKKAIVDNLNGKWRFM